MVIGVDVSRTQRTILTGTERYTFEIVRRLTALLPNVTWRLYSEEPFHSRWSAVAETIERRVLPSRIGTLWTHLTLARELSRTPVDLMFFPGTAIPYSFRGTCVTTIHDVIFLTHPHLYADRPRGSRKRRLASAIVTALSFGTYDGSERGYQRWAFQHALKRAAEIVTVSNMTKRAIEQVAPDHPPIDVVPLGIDADVPTGQVRTDFVPTATPYFLYVGRLERKKNIERLLAAYVSYHQQTPEPWKLVLVGQPGLDWEESSQRHRSFIENGAIVVHHELDDVGRNALYDHAGAVILVSEAEGFGLTVFEAALRRRPVIASPCGAIPEHFGDAYIPVDPRDIRSMTQALTGVHQNRADAERRASDAYRRVLGLTWDSAGQQTANVFSRLLLKVGHKNGIVTTS